MNKFEGESARTPRRPPTTHVVLVSVPSVPFGVLLVIPVFPVIRDMLAVQSGTVQAVAIVGIVLAEAIGLYVGYGALTAIVKPSIRELLGGDPTWKSSG